LPIIAFWKGEGNANDSAGANDGTLQNGAAFAAGQVGQAFSLDGVNDYVSIPDSVTLRPDNLTVEGWFNFGATNGERVLLSKPLGTGFLNSFVLWLDNGALRGHVGDASGGGPIVSHFSFQPVPGQWYHLAYTFDDNADVQTLYVNGLLVASGVTSKTIGYDGNGVVLGADVDRGTPGGFYQGRMDEVSIYPRALSAAEIQGIFLGGTAGKPADQTPPVITCPTNGTAQCDTWTELALMGTATAVDNCDPNPTVTFTDDIAGNPCSPTNMVVTRTWKATDCVGNMATCAQTIIVATLGGAPPTLVCPTNVTVECGADTSPSATGIATVTNTCGTVTIAHHDEGTLDTNCAIDHIVKRILRTWTATNECGNGATCVQTVAVRDTTPPVLNCPPAMTAECLADLPPPDFAGGTATDICGTPVVVHVGDLAQTNGCVITVRRTYRASDACGNTNDCAQTITMQDTSPPTLVCPTNVTVECGADTSPSATGMATVTNTCGTVTIAHHDEGTLDTNCAIDHIVKRIMRTWTATNECGNGATCAQTVTVRDTTPPVLNCPPAMTVECLADLPPPDFAGGTATDICGTPVVVHVGDLAQTNGCAITVTRTYRASDACGNTNDCAQTITVQDTSPPTIICPANATVECSTSTDPSETDVPTAADNCDLSPVLTHSDSETPDSCPNAKVITRTWTAIDQCGHSASCVQTITVRDTTAPVVSCPPDETLECYANVPEGGFAGGSVTDNCGSTPIVAHQEDVAETNNCVITITRTYRASDACGNVTTCRQVIIVQDTVAPTIVCPANAIVGCNTPTDPSATGSATVADNCDLSPVITHSDSETPGSCPNAKVITRTWTATDQCGNSASCTQTIMAGDPAAPSIICPPNVTLACSESSDPSATGSATAADNCDTNLTVTFTDTVAGAPCPASRTITRTWTTTDACGNSATCQQVITVAGPPFLTMSKAVYSPREAIVVNVTNAAGNATDWIGLYKVGAPETAFVRRLYTDGTSAGTAGLTNCTVSFADGLAGAGSYEARLFFNDSFTREASVPFSVQEPPRMLRLSIVRIDQGIALEFEAVAGESYIIEASTDLTHWVPIATVQNVAGRTVVEEQFGPEFSQRFYRAVLGH
jgi:hypothetical protein